MKDVSREFKLMISEKKTKKKKKKKITPPTPLPPDSFQSNPPKTPINPSCYIQSNNSPPRQFHATFNKCIIAGNKGKLTDTITRLERWVVVEMSTFIRSLQSLTFLPEVVSGRRVSETVFPTLLQTVGSK